MALTSKGKLVTSMEDVRSIVKAVGKRLIHIKDTGDFKNKLDMLCMDATVVYVLETGERLQLEPDIDNSGCDAWIFFNGNSFSIHWNRCSQASLRKLLSSDAYDDGEECLVCFEEIGKIDSVSCMQCNATMCFVCCIKMSLTEAINCDPEGYLIRCPECRSKLNGNVLQFYVRVMDRLKEFTPLQQDVLLSIKRNDPKFDLRLSDWKNKVVAQNWVIEQRKARARWQKSKELKQGCTVKLYGLKKKDWNGKKAVIIGKKEVKNGVVRWPIQLKGKCKSKALLKECNMKKK